MKKTKSILLMLLITCSCLFVGSGFAAGSGGSTENPANSMHFPEAELETAPLNPEFVEYRNLKELQSSSGGIVSSYGSYGEEIFMSGLVPAPADHSGAGRALFSGPGIPEVIPEAYDLRSEGQVTSVKDQEYAGSCWAFASLASLESYILGKEGENRDFSENNMKNLLSYRYPEGFELAHDAGGNRDMSTAYLARWTGPVNESDDPYNDLSDYSPLGLPVQKHVQEVLFLPERSRALDNEYIKKALMEYGAVYSAFYWNAAYYQEENYSYMYNTSRYPSSSNHAITIVGWNDSFDKNSFSLIPPDDGAFIVKNSWGEEWGEEGYFYISYYDLKLGYDENAVFTAENPGNYDYIYQYDPFGWVSQMRYQNNTAWGANVFTSEGDETLKAVSFYTTDLNTSYELYIYRDLDTAPINSTAFELFESGEFTLPGYHTHMLGTPVSLSPGQNFSVVINLSNPSYSYPLAYEYPEAGWSTKARANPGESYTSPDGSTWQDISADSEANLCIKAFTTTDELPAANFSANATVGVPPLTVRFTDLSKNAFAREWDLDGDGTVDSTAKNPTCTYDSYGSYTVSLNTSNRNGFDLKTEDYFITVGPLSILSAAPEGNATTFEGEMQEFNITTNHSCRINWYLDGANQRTDSGVKFSSYSEDTLSPGIYNVTVNAETGSERVIHCWNWTVLDWNPWDNPASLKGEEVSTEELQEAIHLKLNGLNFTESGAEPTEERFGQLILMWMEG